MKRLSHACLAALVVLLLAWGPATPVTAQTPVASPVATPDPFTLPVNHLLLRIHEGNGWEYMTGPSGILMYVNDYAIRHGEVFGEMPPDLAEMYSELDTRHLYSMTVIVAPVGFPAGQDGQSGVMIETRLTTFADGDAAARLVHNSPDLLADQSPNVPGAGGIEPIAEVPEHDEAIVGVTGMAPSVVLATGEQSGYPVPYTVYIAQHGTTVASVKVTSLDPTFNDVAARELLAAQLACVEANVFCQPVPIPADVPYEPATPVASPVAVRPVNRTQTS